MKYGLINIHTILLYTMNISINLTPNSIETPRKAHRCAENKGSQVAYPSQSRLNPLTRQGQ
jgi:hypothetical protein